MKELLVFHKKMYNKDKLPSLKEFIEKGNFDSENLYNEISILEESAKNKILASIDWLKKNNINPVLVGGTAVAHHLPLSRKLTPDIDFIVKEIEEVKRKLDDDGITYKPLSYSLGITVEELNMDILDFKSGNKHISSYAMKDNKESKIAGRNVKIASPEILSIMKFDVGRNKDTNDAIALMRSGVVNKEKYLKIVDVLSSHIDGGIKSYADLIN